MGDQGSSIFTCQFPIRGQITLSGGRLFKHEVNGYKYCPHPASWLNSESWEDETLDENPDLFTPTPEPTAEEKQKAKELRESMRKGPTANKPNKIIKKDGKYVGQEIDFDTLGD